MKNKNIGNGLFKIFCFIRWTSFAYEQFIPMTSSGWHKTEERNLTLWQVWWDVWHFLGVDVRPVKVIIGILLVITLREALIKRTAPCTERTAEFSLPQWNNNYWQRKVVYLNATQIPVWSYAEDFGFILVWCFLGMPTSQLISKPPGVWAPTVITQGQSGSPLTRPSEPSADHLSPSPKPRDKYVWAGRPWPRLIRRLL